MVQTQEVKDKPKKLYKYQSFNEYSLENLSNRQIFFSNPLNFNDPYDCDLSITKAGVPDELYWRILEKIVDDNFDETTSDLLDEIQSDQQLNQRYRREIEAFFDDVIINDYLNNRGVVSLSKKNDDILMWGHYADGHKGFCLEFDTEYKPFQDPKKVTYSDEIPTLNVADIHSSDVEDDEMIKPLTTKYSCWKYEKEYRLIHKEVSVVHNYEPKALTGVYFGSEIQKEHRDILCMILKERFSETNLSLYQGGRSDEEFKINFEEVVFT